MSKIKDKNVKESSAEVLDNVASGVIDEKGIENSNNNSVEPIIDGQVRHEIRDSKEASVDCVDDTSFENEANLTKENKPLIVDSTYSFGFIYKYAWANTFLFPIAIIYIVAILLFVGIGVMYLVKDVSWRVLGISFFTLGIVMIPVMAALSNFTMTRSMRSQYAKYGLKGNFVMSFYFEDKITMRNSENKMISIFEYKDIKKVNSALGIVIIEMQTGYRLILDKKGIQDSSVKNLKKYIMDKTVEAKNKNI